MGRTMVELPSRVDDKLELDCGRVSIRIRPASVRRSFGEVPMPERKPKLYVFGEPEPDMATPPYSVKGEDERLDAEWRAYNREEIRIEREYAYEALAALGCAGSALRFSRKAGCSCGCSPGFHVESEALLGTDIFVTVNS